MLNIYNSTDNTQLIYLPYPDTVRFVRMSCRVLYSSELFRTPLNSSEINRSLPNS